MYLLKIRKTNFTQFITDDQAQGICSEDFCERDYYQDNNIILEKVSNETVSVVTGTMIPISDKNPGNRLLVTLEGELKE